MNSQKCATISEQKDTGRSQAYHEPLIKLFPQKKCPMNRSKNHLGLRKKHGSSENETYMDRETDIFSEESAIERSKLRILIFHGSITLDFDHRFMKLDCIRYFEGKKSELNVHSSEFFRNSIFQKPHQQDQIITNFVGETGKTIPISEPKLNTKARELYPLAKKKNEGYHKMGLSHLRIYIFGVRNDQFTNLEFRKIILSKLRIQKVHIYLL